MTKLKKTISILVAFVLVFSFVSVATLDTYAEVPNHVRYRISSAVVLFVGSPRAIVSNEETNVDSTNNQVYPVVKEGRTLVPIRFIAENFGANVVWDGTTSTATIKSENQEIVLKLGSNKMLVNNQEVTLEVPASTIDNRTFIPLRALVEALGKEVFYHKGLIIISETPNILDISRDQVGINDLMDQFNTEIFQLEEKTENAIVHAIFGDESAYSLAEEIIDIAPTSPMGYHAMGNVLMSFDRYGEAIQWFKKAIELDPEYIPAYYDYGMLLYELELYEEAIEIFDITLELAPTYISAYKWKASILEDLSRYDEAIAIYDQAIEMYPDDIDLNYNRANVLSIVDRFEEALPNLDKVIEMDPEFVDGYFLRGYVLASLERYEEALKDLEKADELNPGDFFVEYFIAAVLVDLERYEEAIIILEKVIEEVPGFVYAQELKLEAENRLNNSINN